VELHLDVLGKARKKKGITLRELAGRCSLSPGFLSQVERELVKPSLTALMTICEVLDVPVNCVIVDESKNPFADRTSRDVTRSQERTKIRLGDSPVSFEFLSGGFADRINDLFLGHFPPGYRYPLFRHYGEEFGYVVAGTLIVRIDDASHVLHAGDSYHFSSQRPHAYETPKDQHAVVMWGQTAAFLDTRKRGLFLDPNHRAIAHGITHQAARASVGEIEQEERDQERAGKGHMA